MWPPIVVDASGCLQLCLAFIAPSRLPIAVRAPQMSIILKIHIGAFTFFSLPPSEQPGFSYDALQCKSMRSFSADSGVPTWPAPVASTLQQPEPCGSGWPRQTVHIGSRTAVCHLITFCRLVCSRSPLSIAVPYIVLLRLVFFDYGLPFARGSTQSERADRSLSSINHWDSRALTTQKRLSHKLSRTPYHHMSDFNFVEPKGWEYDLQSVRLIDQRRWLL